MSEYDIPRCPVCGSYEVDTEGEYWYCEDCMYHWPINEQETEDE
jgi:ribosomal protein L37AE/L43A